MNFIKKIFISLPFAIRQGFFAPALWLTSKVVFKMNLFEEYRGIVIAEFGPRNRSDSFFVQRTKEVLDYLADLDPLRFDRIQTEIRAIARSDGGHDLGSYLRPPRVCVVNFIDLGYDTDILLAKKMYSCLLVHEATHGLLFSKKIPYGKKYKQRVEELCAEEEVRVARKFNDGCEQLWEQLHHEKLITGFLNPEILKQIH